MGYDLRITRATDWTSNQGLEISAREWLAVIENDPDLHADPSNGPHAAQFGTGRWFDWFEGNVMTTDPDSATVQKMIDLAQRLSAVVQGDDGEFYDSASQWAPRSGTAGP
ncbi:MAG: hypothetical protein KDC87_20485 [Planctomycetes bacterium]|nr:hypothetical protein [Planctomycetota bacterium]MCB9871090.1 hypothetical protein [Planctomycetota bacterium]MCB9888272.1 hypothetical protein [Planctomycetota bacterium]